MLHIQMPGTKEMADEVVKALKDRGGALIANHGAITIGRNLAEAIYRLAGSGKDSIDLH